MKEWRRQVTGFLKILRDHPRRDRRSAELFGWDARPGGITGSTEAGSDRCDEAD